MKWKEPHIIYLVSFALLCLNLHFFEKIYCICLFRHTGVGKKSCGEKKWANKRIKERRKKKKKRKSRILSDTFFICERTLIHGFFFLFLSHSPLYLLPNKPFPQQFFVAAFRFTPILVSGCHCVIAHFYMNFSFSCCSFACICLFFFLLLLTRFNRLQVICWAADNKANTYIYRPLFRHSIFCLWPSFHFDKHFFFFLISSPSVSFYIQIFLSLCVL